MNDKNGLWQAAAEAAPGAHSHGASPLDIFPPEGELLPVWLDVDGPHVEALNCFLPEETEVDLLIAAANDPPYERGPAIRAVTAFRGVPLPDAVPPVNVQATTRPFRAGWFAAAGAVPLLFVIGQVLIPLLMRGSNANAPSPHTQTALATASPFALPEGQERPTTGPARAMPTQRNPGPLRTQAAAPTSRIEPQATSVPSPSGRVHAAPARREPPVPREETAPASETLFQPSAEPQSPPRPLMLFPTPAVPPDAGPHVAASAATAVAGTVLDAPAPSRLSGSPPVVSAAASGSTRAPAPLPVPKTESAVAHAASAASRMGNDESAVKTVLEGYRTAYSELNADGAKAVWPSVDVRTLSKAFGQLQSQDIEFTSCQVAVIGDDARAVCGGNAAYVPKVGSRNTRNASRQWNFALRRSGERWAIAAVDMR